MTTEQPGMAPATNARIAGAAFLIYIAAGMGSLALTQVAGLVTGGMLSAAWLPMLVFEVPLALWLIVKGVRTAPR